MTIYELMQNGRVITAPSELPMCQPPPSVFEISDEHEDALDNELGPASGILVGLGISLPLWAIIFSAIYVLW